MAIITSRAVGVDTTANRPAFGTAGRLFYATDTNILWYDTGAAWTQITAAGAMLSDPVPIANGGTGQNTQTTAFDALAPTTTLGDLIKHDGTDNIRLAVGSEGTVLRVISGTPAWARSPQAYCLFGASPGTTFSWMPGLSYAPFGDTGQVNKHYHDFTYVSQARLYVRGNLKAILDSNIKIKLVDLTHSVDLTPEVTFLDAAEGTWVDELTAWTDIHANTTGDCYFEAQGYSVSDALKQIYIGTIAVEFR